MNVILFDKDRDNYYPLSFTRPISNFRVGILTIKEKWEQYYKSVSVKTEDYLSAKFPLKAQKDNLWIDARVFPSQALITELNSLRIGEALEKNGEIVAFRNRTFNIKRLNTIDSNSTFSVIANLCDIFSLNGEQIKNDFDRMFTSKKLN